MYCPQSWLRPPTPYFRLKGHALGFNFDPHFLQPIRLFHSAIFSPHLPPLMQVSCCFDAVTRRIYVVNRLPGHGLDVHWAQCNVVSAHVYCLCFCNNLILLSASILSSWSTVKYRNCISIYTVSIFHPITALLAVKQWEWRIVLKRLTK